MLDQDKQWLLTEKYHNQKTPDFLADCKRLEAGVPLAYIIGWVPFLNCKIWLDSRPLIPRPETEYWVEKAISQISRGDTSAADNVTPPLPRGTLGLALGFPWGESLKVLDLCAGSGCIGVAVGKALPNAHITFAEIDPSHLPTIKKNCLAHSPLNWTMVQSNLFENITGKFDFILSNPPYIDPVLDRTETSVKNFEPHLALYGGDSGSELIERIIIAAPTYLNPRGELWLEHEPEQTPRIAELGTQQGFAVSTHVDQFNNLRYSRLVLQ